MPRPLFGISSGFFLSFFALSTSALERRDGEDDELAVGGDDGVAAARLAELGIRLQVADDQLAVALLRRQRVDEPASVARDLRALD